MVAVAEWCRMQIVQILCIFFELNEKDFMSEFNKIVIYTFWINIQFRIVCRINHIEELVATYIFERVLPNRLTVTVEF